MRVVYADQVITMVQNALNLVDKRLVNHGIRVALVMKDMLEVSEVKDKELKKKLCIIAMMHDVGAYQTEEIDNLVQFETATIWQHSIYGYLFLKEFTGFDNLAKVILYHHAEYNKKWEIEDEILQYAQMLHVADRADIGNFGREQRKKEELKNYFRKKSGTLFSEKAVEYFLKADEKFDTLEKLRQQVEFEDVVDYSMIREDEIETYLQMLVHAIDFRSHVTVNHTIGTINIACQLAERMGLSEVEQEQVYYGAMLHDLGKIGTPVSILEKPGRLTEDEMKIMREHVELGRQIIGNCVDETVEKIALRHHEKLDGSGYPLGLSGEELSLAERILAVADITSALGMSRSYKEPFPKERVFSILYDMRDKGQIDGSVLKVLEEGYDDIIKQADDACIPIREVYERIGEEYNMLLKKFTSADHE